MQFLFQYSVTEVSHIRFELVIFSDMPMSRLPNRQSILRKALYIFTPATNLHSRASLPGIDDRVSPDLQSSL